MPYAEFFLLPHLDLLHILSLMCRRRRYQAECSQNQISRRAPWIC